MSQNNFDLSSPEFRKAVKETFFMLYPFCPEDEAKIKKLTTREVFDLIDKAYNGMVDDLSKKN